MHKYIPIICMTVAVSLLCPGCVSFYYANAKVTYIKSGEPIAGATIKTAEPPAFLQYTLNEEFVTDDNGEATVMLHRDRKTIIRLFFDDPLRTKEQDTAIGGEEDPFVIDLNKMGWPYVLHKPLKKAGEVTILTTTEFWLPSPKFPDREIQFRQRTESGHLTPYKITLTRIRKSQ